MFSLNREHGAVLIMVMLFSAVFSIIALWSMEMTWLETKMTQNFNYAIQNRIKEEQELFFLEKEFHLKPKNFIQFIADTIKFNEKTGLKYYKLRTKNIITTQVLSVEEKNENQDDLKFSNGLWGNIDIETINQESHLILKDLNKNVQASFLVSPIIGDYVILATDRLARGWVDALYLGDSTGRIWCLNTCAINYEQWVWHEAGSVDQPIKALYATYFRPGIEPLLIVHAKNHIFGIVRSEIIWSIKKRNLKKIKLKQNWLQLDNELFDVNTGQVALVDIKKINSGRHNWYEPL